ncbi:hypothetical protein [Massilia sp. TS11]|uniref:hypothetical protein n=1 Tax=Massilia sp. TS11 TaxID=2908003 RepID=UPI001EDC0746|nr:hypothetical protein [Massilia sp. TS11]MCG2584136.1 hypothetical protein [Massilia sp. TS11]
MRISDEHRLAPILVCGALSAGLATLAALAYRTEHAAALAPLAAATLAFIASFVLGTLLPTRAQAWRWLWLLVAGLSFLAANLIYQSMLGSPSTLIPQTRGENAPGVSLLVLLGELVFGLGGAVLLSLCGGVALLLAWLMGRRRRATIIR